MCKISCNKYKTGNKPIEAVKNYKKNHVLSWEIKKIGFKFSTKKTKKLSLNFLLNMSNIYEFEIMCDTSVDI